MKPVWTVTQVVAQLTNWQGRWNNSQPVPFTFYNQPLPHFSYSAGFTPFTAAERNALAQVMQQVSDVANITFVNLPDNGQAPSQNNSRIGFFNINQSTAAFWGAATYYISDAPNPPIGRIYGVDVMVNRYRADVQGGWGIGDSNSRKLLHELLHAVGIDHPGDYNGPDSGATYANSALFQQDSHQYTVMSYWDALETGANHRVGGVLQWTSTPLLYDIAALQELYGANMTTRTGDTVYGFNNTSGRAAFDLARDPSSIFTIWDAGGNDTLDLSGYSSASRVDLNEGAFSDAGGMTMNISIAYGAVIENAVGGSGNDVLHGNGARNGLNGGDGFDQLVGAGGGDRLIGGGGGDVFIYGAGADSPLSSLRSDGRKIASDYLPDFVSGVDRIDLSAIDAISSTTSDEAFAFIGTNAFTGTAGQLRFEVFAGQLQICGDVNGDGLADFMIATNSETIAAGDLIL